MLLDRPDIVPRTYDLGSEKVEATLDRLPSSTVAGFAIPGLILELDATVALCHCAKEDAAKTWKKTFVLPPRCCASSASPAKHGVVYWRRRGH